MHETRVNIQIARSSGHPDGPQIHMQIQDSVSRMQILDMYIPLAAFANLITGMSEPDLQAAVASPGIYAQRMGKRHEVKELVVDISDLRSYEPGSLAELNRRAVALESDGWVSEHIRAWNGHRTTSGSYRVSYSRWV